MLNLDNTILILTISGIAKKAPETHHKLDQKMRESIITNELRFSLLPITLGSIMLPVINCGTIRHASKTNDI